MEGRRRDCGRRGRGIRGENGGEGRIGENCEVAWPTGPQLYDYLQEQSLRAAGT